MRRTRFVTLALSAGLLMLIAACGGGGSSSSSTPVDSGSSPSATAGPPAEALLVVADPASTNAALSQALALGSVKKYFLTSRSMDPASFAGLTLSDETIWGTVPTAPFAQADDFNNAYENAYGHPPADVFGTAEAYDSVYVVALAAVAANSADHAAIRDAISYVANSPGDVETYGVGAFTAATGILAAGQDINYIGASGQVDLDSNREIAKSSVQTWRVINGTIARIETRDIDLAAEAGAVLPQASPPLPAATPDTALSIGIIVSDDEDGTAISDAAQLAVDEINAAGGVWGQDISFHIQTIGSAGQVSHAAGLLITDDGVEAIIGPTSADATQEVLAPAGDANVPVLSLSTDPALTGFEDTKNVLFRLVASEALQMPVLANLFLEGHATPTPIGSETPAATASAAGSVCVVYQNGAAFEQMAAAYATAMEFKQAKVRANVSFDPTSANYETLLKGCIGS
jgi:ABC-type branched-subunit amino acid transport system substrate-binding protein